MEGTAFGHYQMLSLLGRGGMGEVWRAYDTRTDRVVAIKLLHRLDDKQFEQRFRREARAAAALSEPHIVPIHRFGEIDGRLYLDMRLIEGRDLRSIIADRRLDADRAVTVVEQIAAALGAAHEVGLVHRDVKPSNILIAAGDFAYLIDFGIARTAADTALTSTGNVLGTWAYMAPERFTSSQIDPRSDTYALACVLHECLTGRPPYPGNSVEDQIAAHLHATPPRPSQIGPDLPTALDDVIARGMAKDPAERFATTVDLATAARAALARAGQSPTVPAPSRPFESVIVPVVGPVADNTPDAVASAPTVAAALPPPSDTAPPVPDPEPPHVHSHPPKRSKRRPGIIIGAAVLAMIVVVGAAALAFTHLANRPSPRATATFEGTFTATYGAQTKFGGTPLEGVVPTATWVVQSTCTDRGCVATAATIDRPQGVLTRTFDYIDGRWVAVSVGSGRNPCVDADSQKWESVSLEPRQDGSLVGQFSSAFENGCSSTSPVTYTRIGDPPSAAELADPATVSAYVVSAASSFRGRYNRTQIDPSQGEMNQGDLAVTTMCLRTGERCLSYLAEIAGLRSARQLVFADAHWIERTNEDVQCDPAADAANLPYQTVYPLPQPAEDPIAQLAGKGTAVNRSGCPAAYSTDVFYTRTGD